MAKLPAAARCLVDCEVARKGRQRHMTRWSRRPLFTSLDIAVGLLLLIGRATAQEYVISTYAGGALLATPVRALEAPIGTPTAVTVDAADNIYFISLDAVFKLDRDGIMTRVAGNSRQGYAGDGGQATSAHSRAFPSPSRTTARSSACGSHTAAR
jgi:hypothetical protein